MSLPSIPQLPKHRIFATLSETAAVLDVQAFVVGGYVRDLALRRPGKDLDIVVLGDGIAFAEALSERTKGGKISVFKTFGTAMLRLAGWELEFVGARKESYSADSRKPSVSAGTLAEDQLRRDFTINAMAISLNSESFGELLDPFDGMGDLERKLIRTPTDPVITYSDDPLRMMRAARFATQLQFDIDPSSFTAISEQKERIGIVSMERISTELNKIIAAPKPSVGFKYLFDMGVLHLILPEMVALHGVDFVDGRGHKDNFYHTLEVLDNVAKMSDNLWLRWAAILHDIAKPETKKFYPEQGWTFHGHEDKGARMVPKIFARLKLPLDAKMKLVQKLVALHLRPIALTKEEATDSAIRRLLFDAGDDIDDLMVLCKCDITSKNPEKVSRYLENYGKVQQKLIAIEEKDRIRNWQPPISGELIMYTFGIKPSMAVGKIKNLIREAILDGRIQNNFEEAFQLMLEEGNHLGLTAVDQSASRTSTPRQNAT